MSIIEITKNTIEELAAQIKVLEEELTARKNELKASVESGLQTIEKKTQLVQIGDKSFTVSLSYKSASEPTKKLVLDESKVLAEYPEIAADQSRFYSDKETAGRPSSIAITVKELVK